VPNTDIETQFKAALVHLERGWEAVGAPVRRCARPGLTSAEIDELMAPLGLRLPVEARLWWQWHNGTEQDLTVTSIEGNLMGPVHRFLRLEEAIVTYRYACELADEAADMSGMAPQEWWDRAWFPVVSTIHDSLVSIDCSVPEGEVSPVRSVEAPDEDRLVIRAPSLTDVVLWWGEAMQSGGWTYDAARNHWVIVESRLDRPIIRQGIL
jgi:cell wall assembly regulator SMI1